MDTNDRTILRRLILVLVVVILIGVVVWVFLIRGNDKRTDNKDAATNTSQTNGGVAQSGTGNQPASGQSQPQPQGGMPAESSSGGAAASQNAVQNQNKQPSQLANAGPGDVVGLFAGATVAGALAHHLYRRSRQRMLN